MKNYITQSKLPEYRKQNTPEECPILGVRMKDHIPVVDHDHKSGKIRGVLSNEGNALLGKIENFFYSRCSGDREDLPDVLKNISEYVSKEQGPYHPVGVRQVTKRFSRMNKSKQELLMTELNIEQDTISKCKNSKQRTKLYRKALISNV